MIGPSLAASPWGVRKNRSLMWRELTTSVSEPNNEGSLASVRARGRGRGKRVNLYAARSMGKKLELTIAILNGAVGDHLARTGNGLATAMHLVGPGGHELRLDREALLRAYPNASPRVVILLHGLMCTEDIWAYTPGGDDYGSMLARDLGFTPFYVRYNSGRSIAENGREFASLLARLVAAYPVAVQEIVPLGYSMGGLVVRSACHAATVAHDESWLPFVRRALYVGTPHQGAPMERVGRLVSTVLRAVDDPYTRLVAEIADVRSDGVKDLGHADLREEDRARRSESVSLRDPRHPVPLLPRIQHFLVAGSLSTKSWVASLFGDSMVPLKSATDGGCVDAKSFAFPPDHVAIVHGASHVALAHDPRVYEHLKRWCAS